MTYASTYFPPSEEYDLVGIGNTMGNYHLGLMDPVYMVGSVLRTGEPYPEAQVEKVISAHAILSNIFDKLCNDPTRQYDDLDDLEIVVAYLSEEVERITGEAP